MMVQISQRELFFELPVRSALQVSERKKMSFLVKDTTLNEVGLELEKKSHLLFAKGSILAI